MTQYQFKKEVGLPWSLGNGPAPTHFALNPWDLITFQDYKRTMYVLFVSSMGADGTKAQR